MARETDRETNGNVISLRLDGAVLDWLREELRARNADTVDPLAKGVTKGMALRQLMMDGMKWRALTGRPHG